MKKVLLLVLILGLLGTASADLKDGLVGYWPLDGEIVSGDTVADMSTGGHDGVLTGTATSVPGILGEGLLFDGNGGNAVDCGTWNPSETTGELSISIWANWSGENGLWQGIIGKRDRWQESGRQVEYCWFAEINVTAESLGINSTDHGVGLGNMEIGVWTHIAVSFDGTTAVTYRDGVEVNRGDFSIGDKLDAHILLGACDYDTSNDWIQNNFFGIIDEAAIWDRALTPEEVTELYNDGQGTQLSNPWNATNPSPVSGATGVDASGVTLAWEPPTEAAPGPIVKYNVHFSDNAADLSDPNDMSFLKGAVSAAGDLQIDIAGADLANNMTYYWRVDTLLSDDAKDPNNATGSVWKFATVFTPPVITAQPQGQMVFPGDDAQFAIEATSVEVPLSYQWYHNGAPYGGDTATLDFASVEESDTGEYYCVVTNNIGQESTSATVKLGTKHLMAHYPLDDALTVEDTTVVDISGNGHNGTLVGGVSSVDGIIGTAAAFDGVEGSRIDISTWNPSEKTDQLSVSSWVQWNGTGATWQGFIGKRDGWNDDDNYWHVECTANDIYFQTRSSWVGTGGWSDHIGQWKHIVVTFDGTTGTMYMDGMPVSSGGFSFGQRPDSMLSIGCAEAGGKNPWSGNVDDVQIYNYSLTHEEVAVLYTGVRTDEKICLGNPPHDLDGNCRIGIGDLVMLVEQWMVCNLVPECKP